jgi:chromate transport protein ChrA
MTEATVRGLIQGGAFLIVGLLATLIWKLLRSKSEGARRLKRVLGAGLAICIIAIFGGGRPMDTIIVIAALAAAVWVYRGFKKKA